jgi:choline dehydrogenase-like flavoprotein
MFFVVGSGPSGVACAIALLDRGHAVTMLDAGLTLEPEKQRVLEPLRTEPRERWSEEAISLLRSGTSPTTSGVPLKLAYGSDYPYRAAEQELRVERSGVACRPSLARGGFSNVWGASILPFRDDDTRDWPIRMAELAPHYRAVLGWMPHSAVHDDLEELLPTYSECASAVPVSRQARELLHDLAADERSLGAAGVRFGRARVAIDPQCIRCGFCMYGCPRDYVFNAATKLPALLARTGFTYEPNVLVERVREESSQVVLETRALEGGDRRTFRGERAFLGTGPIPTTRILLESMEAWDRDITLKDSQYYMFPILRDRSSAEFDVEPAHTLAQVFVEIQDRDISPYLIHLQLYAYNDLYARVFERMLGPLYKISMLPLRAVVGRMWLVQGYLHSSHSPGITARLLRAGSTSRLTLTARESAETRNLVKRVVKKVGNARSGFKATPVSPMLTLGDAGQGYHVGGGFPMRAKPQRFETDTLGRPHGFERLHLVDSSTFPSIPTTTMTLSVMANAHRIGSSVPTTES